MTTRRRDEGRRAEIEADLTDKYHVDYSYLTGVSTSEFDIDKSLSNQARFESINDETVETYKEAIERGDKFPAVIAHRPGRGNNPKLVIIDGNHRLVAHDRADVPIDVYEVDRSVRAPAVAMMTFAFNTRHGRPTSEDERVTQAMYLIDNGSSQEAAAAAVNVPIRLVRKAVTKANADRRADEVGVERREWDTLPNVSKSRLLQINTDEGFAGAVHLAFAARLGTDEVMELTSLLNTNRSGNKQKALVKAETERYAERIQDSGVLGTTVRKALTPKSRVGMVLGQIMALPEDLDALARSYADGERSDTAMRITEAAERLQKLAKILDSRQR